MYFTFKHWHEVEDKKLTKERYLQHIKVYLLSTISPKSEVRKIIALNW